MNPKNTIQEKVELILADLHAKIDQLKEKVEKLCESTDCFEDLEQNKSVVDKKQQNK
tara:strand:+ start:226 stop:396 length:171 start_codon:yes stop_codon:yes gene_type:complete